MITGMRESTILPDSGFKLPQMRLSHIMLLIALVVLSSLGTIYFKYRMQERFLQLNQANAAWHHLHEQSDRLSLERQTLLARSSVLAKARALGMQHHR